MNPLQPSVADPIELDGLLRGFFQAQVPEPWPVLKAPATPSLPGGGAVARRPSRFGSRFALAASLLILLISQLFVGRMFLGSSPFAADRDRGRTEATNRTDSGIPRGLKPALNLHKAERIHPSGSDR